MNRGLKFGQELMPGASLELFALRLLRSSASLRVLAVENTFRKAQN